MATPKPKASLRIVPSFSTVEAALEDLRQRRDGGEDLPAAEQPLDLSKTALLGADLARLDLSGAKFNGADLTQADLTGSRLAGVQLEEALLFGATLDDAELIGANLNGADLSEVSAQRAGFGRATLAGAQLIQADLSRASMGQADLTNADLRAASLTGARLGGADLSSAVLDRASFCGADLSECRVGQASFRDADLRETRLRSVRDYTSADWVGTDIREADFCGAWLLRRHILDVNFLDEFRSQSATHEAIYRLWWITSDCGRSIGRWAAVTAFVALLYAGIYTVVDIDFGPSETWLSPLYFSVVTFTTLGFGDVLPSSVVAQAVVISEVILGYLGLGGLLSILADKMARRAG